MVSAAGASLLLSALLVSVTCAEVTISLGGGHGFHRRVTFTVTGVVPEGPDRTVAIDISFGRAYFVDPFEATEVIKTTIDGGSLLKDSVTTNPPRVDLEAPDFSPLVPATTVVSFTVVVRTNAQYIRFDLPMHARYTSPKPATDAPSPSYNYVNEHFSLGVGIAGQELKLVRAEEYWPIPRGDAAFLPVLYWTTTAIMTIGSAAVIAALLC